MEQRKGGYCNLTKLRSNEQMMLTKLQVEEEIIDPSKIGDEMKTFDQNIFNRQEVKEGMEAIDEFVKLDNDDNPYQKLLNRRIFDEIRDSMEGNMSLQEMTKALNEDMKGTFAPWVDRFTFNFIRKIWDSLGSLVVKVVDKCKGKKYLTSTLITAIFKLLRKGDKDPI